MGNKDQSARSISFATLRSVPVQTFSIRPVPEFIGRNTSKNFRSTNAYTHGSWISGRPGMGQIGANRLRYRYI